MRSIVLAFVAVVFFAIVFENASAKTDDKSSKSPNQSGTGQPQATSKNSMLGKPNGQQENNVTKSPASANTQPSQKPGNNGKAPSKGFWNLAKKPQPKKKLKKGPEFFPTSKFPGPPSGPGQPPKAYPRIAAHKQTASQEAHDPANNAA